MRGVTFNRCDTVVVKGKTPIHNAIALQRVTMIGGSIWNCTLMIPRPAIQTFAEMNAVFITPTGVPEIDNPPPQEPEEKTQP
jgi:hypothetical protein